MSNKPSATGIAALVELDVGESLTRARRYALADYDADAAKGWQRNALNGFVVMRSRVEGATYECESFCTLGRSGEHVILGAIITRTG